MSSALHPNTPAECRLLVHSILWLVAGATCVMLCYFFIDRPVAQWVESQQFGENRWLRWPTLVVPWLWDIASPLAVVLVVRRAFGPWRRWELVLLAMVLNLMVCGDIKDQLKWVFGRPWPDTWIQDNPSFLKNGEYAFHWFAGSDRFGSMPSGHTMAMCAVASVAWVAWPKARIAAALAVFLVVVALVGDNYHFVGDCVAGGLLGSLGGVWATRLIGVNSANSPT